MDSIFRKFQSFNGVGVNQVANISVTSGGPVYNYFLLEGKHDPGAAPGTLMTAANFSTFVENIKVKVDGDVLWDLSGAELVDLNNYYGIPMVDGYFTIPFNRPEFLDPTEQRRFALGTLGVRNVTVEVKLDNTVASPELAMWGEVATGGNRPSGQLIRVRSTAQSAQAASGLREIHDLPVTDQFGVEPQRGLRALHIKSALITEHEIKMNSNTISEAPTVLANLMADIHAFSTVSRTPQAGYTHLDFTGNRYSGILGMTGVTDFRLLLTFSGAAAAFSIIHEEVVGQRDI